jgi:hypothetical protein
MGHTPDPASQQHFFTPPPGSDAMSASSVTSSQLPTPTRAMSTHTPPRNASPYGNNAHGHQQQAPTSVSQSQQTPMGVQATSNSKQPSQSTTPQQTPTSAKAPSAVPQKTPISPENCKRSKLLLEINSALFQIASMLQQEGKSCALSGVNNQDPPAEHKEFIA